MASLHKIQTSMVGTESELAQLILVTLQPAPAVVYFFQVGVLFNTENATFFLQIYAPFDVLFTGLNNEVVHQIDK